MGIERKMKRQNKNKQAQTPADKPPLCPHCGFSVIDPQMICRDFNSRETFVMIICPHCKKFLDSHFRPTVLMQGVDPADIEAMAKGKTKSGLIVSQSALVNSRKRDIKN